MNKIFKRKKFILATLALIMLGCIIVFSVMNRVNAISYGLYKEYELGQTITIPDHKIKVDDGFVVVTDYCLEYPDGVWKTGRQHKLDLAGYYTVHYYAENNGKSVEDEFNFKVINDLYSFENPKSSVSYGVNQNFTDGTPGLVLSIANKDKVIFNKIIDLSDNTKNDKLLSFYITPMEIGNFDAAYLTFRFTDAYDPENYLDVIYKCHYGVRTWADVLTYIVCQTPGNPTVGGTGENAYIGKMWGFPTYQTFCGLDKWGKVWEIPYNLFYDNQTKSVWTDRAPASSSFAGGPIADLDDPLVFTNPWKGFTTGEVFLSVFASSYRSPTMNLVLTQLKGYDLTKTNFIDEKAPEITIYTEGDGVIPEGVKGKPYNVFDAVAMDNYDQNVAVNVNVFFKYGTAAQVDAYVKDGYFYPDKVGTYTIVYTAKDAFNNKSVKTVDVNVVDENMQLDARLIGQKTEGISGPGVKVLDGIEISGAKGNTQTIITATKDSNVYILDANYSFSPLSAGVYDINVSVSDYVETVNYNFEFNVLANNDPIFDGDVNLPKYFIKGQKYTIPDFYGYDLSSGNPVKLDAEVAFKEDGGEENVLSDKVVVINADETVRVSYIINANGKTTRKDYDIQVIDPYDAEKDIYDVSRFFRIINGSGMTAVDEDCVRFSTSEDNSKVVFANAVQVLNFVTKFRWGETKTSFEGINIYLTDKADNSIMIKISYKWVNELGYIAINDGNYIQVPISSSTSDRTSLTIGYVNESKQVYGHKSLMMNVNETFYGKPFDGFTSDMAYVEYELFGVSGQSEICISRINNQAMYDFGSDELMEPELFTKRSNGDVALNDTVAIYGARVFDVLSNSTTLTLQVQAPDGSYVVAADGTKLDKNCDPSKNYTITAAQYGKYIISFNYSDMAGNRGKLSYGFTVIDRIAPMISISTADSKAKVGDIVEINKYQVEDNIDSDGEITVAVYVLNPKLVYSVVNDGKFTATEKGIYYIYYYCFDSLNNMTVVNYKVVVE